jgi:hypothetical protein
MKKLNCFGWKGLAKSNNPPLSNIITMIRSCCRHSRIRNRGDVTARRCGRRTADDHWVELSPWSIHRQSLCWDRVPATPGIHVIVICRGPGTSQYYRSYTAVQRLCSAAVWGREINDCPTRLRFASISSRKKSDRCMSSAHSRFTIYVQPSTGK